MGIHNHEIEVTQDIPITGDLLQHFIELIHEHGCICGEEITNNNHVLVARPHSSGLPGQINGQRPDQYNTGLTDPEFLNPHNWALYVRCTAQRKEELYDWGCWSRHSDEYNKEPKFP